MYMYVYVYWFNPEEDAPELWELNLTDDRMALIFGGEDGLEAKLVEPLGTDGFQSGFRF